jgi:uncharacterized protein (TIGR02444 family)
MEVDAICILSSQRGSVADIPQQRMNASGNPEAAGGELWSFSLAFYQRSGVAAALIALQDGGGADINLILFAIWLGLTGRGRLDDVGADAAEHAVCAIRVDVVEPLRALRRRLKAIADADIQRLREAIKALEIDAERVAQFRVAALAGPVLKADGGKRVADAEANLVRCLGPTAAQNAAATIIRDELKRFADDPLSPLRPARPSA